MSVLFVVRQAEENKAVKRLGRVEYFGQQIPGSVRQRERLEYGENGTLASSPQAFVLVGETAQAGDDQSVPLPVVLFGLSMSVVMLDTMSFLT